MGHEVTWDPEIEISHVHTDKCWKLTCGKKEHTHSVECLNCPHTHDAACYGGTNKETPYDEKTESDKENIEQFTKLFGTLQNGYVYRVRCDGALMTDDYDKYYLYFGDTWYLASANACDGGAVKQSEKINAHDHRRNLNNKRDQFWAYKAKLSCTHTHDATCYNCGMEEHDHSDACGTLICGLSETPKKYMSDIQPGQQAVGLQDQRYCDGRGRRQLCAECVLHKKGLYAAVPEGEVQQQQLWHDQRPLGQEYR